MFSYTAEQLATARQLSAELRSTSDKLKRGKANGKSEGTSRVSVPTIPDRSSETAPRTAQSTGAPTTRKAASLFEDLSSSSANAMQGQDRRSKPSDYGIPTAKTGSLDYASRNYGNTPGQSLPTHLQADSPIGVDAQVRGGHLSALPSSQVKFAVQGHGTDVSGTRDNGKKLTASSNSYRTILDLPSNKMSRSDHHRSPNDLTDGIPTPDLIEVEVTEGWKAQVDTSQPVIWNWMSGEAPKIRQPATMFEHRKSPPQSSADIFSNKTQTTHIPLSPIVKPQVHIGHSLSPPVVEFYQSPGREFNSVTGTVVQESTLPSHTGSWQEACKCNRDLSTIKGLGGSRFSEGNTRPVHEQNRFTGACPVHYEQSIHEIDTTLSSSKP